MLRRPKPPQLYLMARSGGVRKGRKRVEETGAGTDRFLFSFHFRPLGERGLGLRLYRESKLYSSIVGAREGRGLAKFVKLSFLLFALFVHYRLRKLIQTEGGETREVSSSSSFSYLFSYFLGRQCLLFCLQFFHLLPPHGSTMMKEELEDKLVHISRRSTITKTNVM